MTNFEKQLKINIEALLKKGTVICSFRFKDEPNRRNGVIGLNRAISGKPRWGVQTSRSLRYYRGDYYLVFQENNKPFRPIKTIKLSDISDPSPVLCRIKV